MKLNSLGSDILKINVSPAEVMILNKGFEKSVNGIAIKEVEVIGVSKRSDKDELERLNRRYKNLRQEGAKEGQNVVKELYPGVGAALPKTFAEIGVKTSKGTKFVPKNYNPVPKDVITAEDIEPDPLEAEPLDDIEPLAPVEQPVVIEKKKKN